VLLGSYLQWISSKPIAVLRAGVASQLLMARSLIILQCDAAESNRRGRTCFFLREPTECDGPVFTMLTFESN